MMLLFKLQGVDSSFTDFNSDFIKGFTLNLSRDPAAWETNKYKQIENEGNKKVSSQNNASTNSRAVERVL